MCDRPHIVGANKEELAVLDLIAEREGVEPQQRKKWSKILDAFGALAFAIAPLHSTFIQKIDGVSCHLGALSRAHCKCHNLDCGWRVKWLKLLCTLVLQSQPPPQGPQQYISRCLGCNLNPNLSTSLTHAFLVMAHLTSPATNVRFFIVPCMRQSCVNWRCALGCANIAVVAVASAVVPLLLLTPVLVVPAVVAAFAVNTRRGVWIRRKSYAVPPQYPQNADGQLQNDQESCFKLQGELKTALFGMCTHNPTVAAKPRHADNEADLIFGVSFVTTCK